MPKNADFKKDLTKKQLEEVEKLEIEYELEILTLKRKVYELHWYIEITGAKLSRG